MKFLGLDIGESRIGVAYCDTSIGIVFPREAIIRKNLEVDLNKILNILEIQKIDVLVVGLPINMNNTKSKAQDMVESFVNEIRKKFNKKIDFFDERLTTKYFENTMNLKAKNRKKGNIDSLSASLILEGYLKSNGLII